MPRCFGRQTWKWSDIGEQAPWDPVKHSCTWTRAMDTTLPEGQEDDDSTHQSHQRDAVTCEYREQED